MEKIRNLIDFLNENTKYYDEGKPRITDKQWDESYFELQKLEAETGLIYPDSPTQSISYQVVNNLEKITHSHQMLSLAKTKDIDEVISFLGKEDYLMMCKMDGLTCSLTYEDGNLISAETRGNGQVGENIFHNALVLPSIPKSIGYKERLVIDGEIISTYYNFENFSNQYKNPRNFASGSIRLLDSAECSKRGIEFVAWDIIEGLNNHNLSTNLSQLELMGFTVVPFIKNSVDVEQIKSIAEFYSYPIDGAVFKFDNISYGKSLGQTAHHFKNAIAYKFYDETYETELIDIEWSMGRTGILTPIAIFNPVEIEGSIIERCSLFNLSVLEEKLGKPYVGQKLWISKRNMVIPYIEKAEKLF